MGYTHYMKQEKKIKLAPLQKELIKEVLQENKKILFGWEGKGKPVFNDKEISFNGNALTDEDHESFSIEFEKISGFEFCKTAAKPYDLAVCKILLILSLSEGFSFSSDGSSGGKLTEENWPEALTWFIQKGYADTIEKKIIPSLSE